MEAKRNIVFSAAVWVAYVLVFAVQKPFFLFYNRDVWTEMSAFDWGQAFVSGLLFDVLLAACFALFPVLLTFLRSRLSERAAEGVLRVYFLGTALYIAAVFAFSGVLFESTILKTVLFIGLCRRDRRVVLGEGRSVVRPHRGASPDGTPRIAAAGRYAAVLFRRSRIRKPESFGALRFPARSVSPAHQSLLPADRFWD